MPTDDPRYGLRRWNSGTHPIPYRSDCGVAGNGYESPCTLTIDTVAGAWALSHGERRGSQVSEDGSNSAALSTVSAGPTARGGCGYESCRSWNPGEESSSIPRKELVRQRLDMRMVLISLVREVPSRNGEPGPEDRGR